MEVVFASTRTPFRFRYYDSLTTAMVKELGADILQPQYPDDATITLYYHAYRKQGGHQCKDWFKRKMDHFIEVLEDMYVHGIPKIMIYPDGKEFALDSEQHAFHQFVTFSCGGNHEEAKRIFLAVDSIHAFT